MSRAHTLRLGRVVLLALAANALSACTIATAYRSDGSVVRHHLGYVQVINRPLETEGGGAIEVNTLGLRVGHGSGVAIGAINERSEFIPLDGRIVIRVRSDRQAQQVIEQLKQIFPEGLCVIVTP